MDNSRDAHGACNTDAPLTTTPAEKDSGDMADSHSTSGRAPAFQFYPKDFLSDINVVCMSMSERGCYITLLCVCWTEGTLPANPDRLARLCGMSPTSFQKFWPALEPCFRVERRHADRLIHPRLEREREKQAEFRGERSAAGKRGADKRWKDKAKPSPENGSAIKEPMAVGSSSSAISDLQSPDSSRKSVARGFGGGVMTGALPRDHMNCRQPCERVCLSEKQHAILRERHGGSDSDMDAFYREVRSRLDPSVPIGERPWQFWEAQFAAKFGSVAVVNPRTAGNAAAAARFIARGQK